MIPFKHTYRSIDIEINKQGDKMKYLIIVLLMICSVFAECDCNKYVGYLKDEMTDLAEYYGIYKIAVSADKQSGFTIIMANATYGAITAIGITFEVYGASVCIDEGNEAIVLFIDGSRFKFIHKSEYNCKRTFFAFFSEKINPELYQSFQTKRVKALRIYTTDSFVNEEFTLSNRVDFQCMFKCLAEKREQ